MKTENETSAIKTNAVKITGFKEILKLFFAFFKIGAFTVGGGLAMIPVIRKEVVEKRKWVDDAKIVDIFAISQSLPGVIAVNSSMYLGYEIAGIPGLIAASIGVIMPSFIIILSIAFFLTNIGESAYLSRFFSGVLAGVVPLILLAAYRLSKTAVKDLFGIIIAVLSIVASIFFRIDLVFIVLGSAVAGYIFYTYKRGGFKK